MEATNPQANAQLVSCHTSEMQGERIVKVDYGHPAHEQFNLLGGRSRNPYASLTYTMASGKVFVLTSSMGEINCYRSSVDAPPTVEPPAPKRDSKREALWVLKLGTRDSKDVYVKNPSHNTRTMDLEEAYGWYYKKDAQAELDLVMGHSASSLGLDPADHEARAPKVGRRSSFRK